MREGGREEGRVREGRKGGEEGREGGKRGRWTVGWVDKMMCK